MMAAMSRHPRLIAKQRWHLGLALRQPRNAGEPLMRDHQIYDPEVETRPVSEQFALDRESYRRQVAYLMANS